MLASPILSMLQSYLAVPCFISLEHFRLESICEKGYNFPTITFPSTHFSIQKVNSAVMCALTQVIICMHLLKYTYCACSALTSVLSSVYHRQIIVYKEGVYRHAQGQRHTAAARFLNMCRSAQLLSACHIKVHKCNICSTLCERAISVIPVCFHEQQ